MSTRAAYKADISLSYINDGSSTSIDSKMVKYIMIENMYVDRFMPVIYISLSVTNDMYSNILSNQKTAKIAMTLYRYNAYSNTALYKRDISGQFTYILSTSNPNYSEELTTDSNSVDAAYRTITLALMSMELLNLSKTSFNGIYGNIDENTLILKAMEGTDAVVKPPKYNPTYDTILIPPMNSKIKLLEYLFYKCPFYDTNYMFFMDFNKSYLLDLTGESCDAKDNTLNTVIFDVRKVTASEAYYEGMSTQNGTYYIYINPANTNISENKSTDKVANQLVFVEDDGTVDYVDIDANNNSDSTVKQTFKRGNNAVLYKNIAESNTVIIEMTKDNIDSSVITPNKTFYIQNYADYADYNGKYTLLYKKEIVKNTNGSFGLSVCIGLRKVGNITALGNYVAVAAAKASMSASARYTSTANSSSSKTYATTAKSTSSSATPSSSTVSSALPKVLKLKAPSQNSNLKRIPKNINRWD